MPTKIVVIGAGWSGLASAKTYLQVDPTADLTILDDDTSIGGVWSRRRNYPGLVANSPRGLYEFSDLTMVTKTLPALKPISGGEVQNYLEQYAQKHGLTPRIRFNTKVLKAEKDAHGRGWIVHTEAGDTFPCDKLLVATGLSSKPKKPQLPGTDFTGVIMHTKTLGQQHHILSSSKINSVVVVGGCKSAIEACSIALQAGKRVHWVVRLSSQGAPLIVVDPNMKPNLLAVNNTRLFTVFSPSIFATSGFWYSFLHSGTSFFGNILEYLFWNTLSAIMNFMVGYSQSFNGRSIRPTSSNLFRCISYISLVFTGHPFLAYLHAKTNPMITVHRATPTRLTSSTMLLSNDTEVPADAVIYATGWQSSTDFFSPATLAPSLGIPHPTSTTTTASDSNWSSLTTSADVKLLKLLPNLKDYPPVLADSTLTSYRLYRCILPPALAHPAPGSPPDRSLAFVGMISSSQTAIASELSALWAVAYLDDLLPASSSPANMPRAELESDIALTQAWQARRYGARGARDPEIILEIQSFLDVLCRDLQVKVERKRVGWLGWLWEWTVPYTASDYKGVVEEFMDGVRARREAEAALQWNGTSGGS